MEADQVRYTVYIMLKSHPLVLTRTFSSHFDVAVDEMGVEHSAYYLLHESWIRVSESPPSRMQFVVGSSSQGSSSSPRLHYNSSRCPSSAKYSRLITRELVEAVQRGHLRLLSLLSIGTHSTSSYQWRHATTWHHHFLRSSNLWTGE